MTHVHELLEENKDALTVRWTCTALRGLSGVPEEQAHAYASACLRELCAALALAVSNGAASLATDREAALAETVEPELDVVAATRACGALQLLVLEFAAERGVLVSPAEQLTIASHVNAIIVRAATTRVRRQGEDAWRTAHQLRNPLGSAMLALTLLRSRVEFGAEDRLVDTLERNLRRLGDLIEESAAHGPRSSGEATSG